MVNDAEGKLVWMIGSLTFGRFLEKEKVSITWPEFHTIGSIVSLAQKDL